MVPTPSIGSMYMRILRCIRRGVSGALIYGHTRWGKTYAIRYCVRLLRDELPRTAIFHLGMPQNPSRSESLFFGMLLAAARHERPDSGTALQRRFRLYNRLAEIVERASGKSLALICMDRVKCQSAVSRSLTGQGRASARRSGPLTRRRFSMLCIGREGGACALTTMRDRLSDGLYQQGVWARTRRLSDG